MLQAARASREWLQKFDRGKNSWTQLIHKTLLREAFTLAPSAGSPGTASDLQDTYKMQKGEGEEAKSCCVITAEKGGLARPKGAG